jgi:xanthine dehydrogenase YagR molybdenum-binding subunit
MKRPGEFIPTYMPTKNRPINDGASMNDDTSRLDAVAKVTGRAKFGRDVYLPESLFACFIRCPYGAGRLESFDVEKAKAVDGVIEVQIDAAEGRYQGHNVGHLVAESKQAMQRGVRALNARWNRQRVNTKIVDAMSETPGRNAQTERILGTADHTLESVYTTPVQTHSSLETHGAVVHHRGDSAIAYVSTQGTSAATDGLSQALDLPQSKYEVICEYIGGGFGSKLNGAGKEGVTAARISKKYNRPVYLFVDRQEDHLDTGNRPSSRSIARIGFKRDGTILGGQIHTYGGVGVGSRGGGVRFPSGRYDLGEIQRTHEDVSFNGGAPRPMRAPGCPQGAFAEELMLDEIATIAGVDPVDLRIKHETDDDRKEMFRLGATLIGWTDRKATGSQTAVIRHGYGCGSASWGRFPARAECEVVINRDGSVEARTGTQDIGTGQRTVMGVCAADAIGIPLRNVNVLIGHSKYPPGPGSGGSMTAHNTAPAMTAAGRDAKAKLLQMIADREGIDASDLDIVGGEIRRNGSAVMSWSDACRLLNADGITGRGEWNRQRLGQDDTTGHSHGVQFVKLHVDTETGVIKVDHIVAIQACGKVVVRKTAEHQIIGGVIQGISFALFENKILDRNTGTMVNPNLEMYKVLGPDDMPHIEPVLWRKNQTGVRSLGEPPTIPTAGAIACAVYNAIGAPVRNLPLTPDKVLAALEGGAA